MKKLSLDMKIKMTRWRIRQWYEYFDGNVYVSFSGGKDSTVLLHIVREMYPDVKAVFVDTGLEYPQIREFVRTFDNIVWLRPKKNFRQIILEYGYPLISKEVSGKIAEARSKPDGYASKSFIPGKRPGRFDYSKYTFLIKAPFLISNKCCYYTKKQPLIDFEKRSGLKPITAQLACESQARTTEWLEYGCNAFDKKRPISNPMSFWTEQDILRYAKEFIEKPMKNAFLTIRKDVGRKRAKAIKYIKHNGCRTSALASVYGQIVEVSSPKYRDDGQTTLITTGCDRTGCMYCCYGCHRDKYSRFKRLNELEPVIYEYVMRSVEEGGLGLKNVFDWINQNSGGVIHIDY